MKFNAKWLHNNQQKENTNPVFREDGTLEMMVVGLDITQSVKFKKFLRKQQLLREF
jgi:hypothetical protein